MPYEKGDFKGMTAELDKELKTLTFLETAERKSAVANTIIVYLKHISEYANEVDPEVKESYNTHKKLIEGGLWKIYSKISEERDEETQIVLTAVCNACYKVMEDIRKKLEG